MVRPNQRGSSTVLLVSVVTLSCLFIGALIFGLIEFSNAQNYQNNINALAAKQVQIAVAKASSAKDNEFTEKEKNPLKTYKGPDTYGGVTIKYPKTWSAYVISGQGSNNPIEGYFHPNYVPGTQSDTAYALRLQITSNSYDEELKQFSDEQDSGTVKITPYRAPKVSSKLGVKVTGEVAPGKQGVVILLPLRDKTLKVWTESTQYLSDFNKNILPNLTFSP